MIVKQGVPLSEKAMFLKQATLLQTMLGSAEEVVCQNIYFKSISLTILEKFQIEMSAIVHFVESVTD